MDKKPEVVNAADPKQVKRAGRIEKEREASFLDGLREVMGTAAGRALVWQLIGRTKVYSSVFDRDAGVMAYLSGRQDVGHELLASAIECDATLYLDMEREARERDVRAQEATNAAHTPSADDEVRDT